MSRTLFRIPGSTSFLSRALKKFGEPGDEARSSLSMDSTNRLQIGIQKFSTRRFLWKRFFCMLWHDLLAVKTCEAFCESRRFHNLGKTKAINFDRTPWSND